MIPTIQGTYSPEKFIEKYKRVLPYEHISQDLSPLILSIGSEKDLFKGTIELSQLHTLAKDPFKNPTNAILNDCEPAILHDLKHAECCAILDTSVKSYGADYDKLRRISKESGIGIICGIEPDIKLYQESNTEEANVQLFYNDIAFIIDHGLYPNCYPGFLGVFIVDSDKSLPPLKTALLKAYIQLLKKYDIPLFIELKDFACKASAQAFDIIKENLTNLSKVIVQTHDCLKNWDQIDPLIFDFLSKGATLCLTVYSSPFAKTEGFSGMTWYSERLMRSLELAIKFKWENQLIVSNGINYKTQLISYGGMGYNNLFENILPSIEKIHGRELAEKVSATNIVKLLSWWKEKPKEEVKLKTWKCRWCKKEYEENKESFSKHEFLYCSMECLRAHTKANFK